ncbi:MAG: polyprenyl synthetase family protein [Paracoccaceae bacterium]
MFAECLADVGQQVDQCFDEVLAGGPDLPLVQAMRYAVRGGKHLRAFLVIESARLHGVAADGALFAATAVEAMHAYSLIHDDLPCMDDDDLRRGQPTVHVKWDEATAVLAGDALQALAFSLLADARCHRDATIRLTLTQDLAKSSGWQGMVLGQALDIAAETVDQPLNLGEITEFQSHKTGALIEWSAQVGPVLAGTDPANMRHYSRALGLAFQIADDILDVEGDAAKAGKRLGKDAAAGKATFVSLLGLKGAKARAKELVSEAEQALEPYGKDAETLRQAARFVISREV